MPSFKQDLNWSFYQDQQLKILESLNKSFSSSLDTSKKINNSLDDMVKTMSTIGRATEALASHFIPTYQKSMNKFENSIKNVSRSLEEAKDKTKKFSDKLDEWAKEREGKSTGDKKFSIRDIYEASEESTDEFMKKLDSSKILHAVIDLSRKIGEMTEQYKLSSNDLMKNTGASLRESQIFRSAVDGVTKQLNRETGNYYNSKETYQQMVSLANQTNIGDLNVLQAIARPILLANESIDVNIAELGTLLGRWNARYNFSTMSMEELVGDIRGYTAGNLANAESALRGIETLQTHTELMAGGDADKLSAASAEITKVTSWLGSLGLDEQFIDKLSSDVYSIVSGTGAADARLNSILAYSDISMQEAYKMGQELDYGSIYLALFEGLSNMGKDVDISNNLAASLGLGAYGVTYDEVAKAYTARNLNKNYTGLENFLPDETTPAGAVEGKYVGWIKEIRNYLSNVWDDIASWEEKIHGGFSDIATIAGILLGAKTGWTLITTIIKSIGAKFGIGAAAKAATDAAAAGGAAAGAAKGATGAAAATTARKVLGTAGRFAGLAGNVGLLMSLTGSSQDFSASWERKRQEGKSKGLSGEELRQYIIDNSIIDTNITSDLQTGRKLTKEERYNMGLSDLDHWFDNIESQEAKMNSLLLSSEFYQSFYDAVSKELWDKGVLSEEFLLSTLKSLGIDNPNQKFMSALVNTMFGDGDDYRSPSFWYTGELADKSLSEFILANLNNTSDWSVLDNMPGYATGTNYISKDQIAMLHEGEAVIPAKYNPSANVTELEMLREQSKSNQLKVSQESEKRTKYLQETVEALLDIKEFLTKWQESDMKKRIDEENRSRFSAHSKYLSKYLSLD